jgi:L-amino acid N-acyltransferase YncA
MLVRAAEPRDAPAIAAVYAHYVHTSVASFATEAPSPQDWLDTLDQRTAQGLPLVVGDEDGVVVGYAQLSPWRPRPAYRFTVEDSIYLHPDHTGRGFGRALLAEVLRRGGAAGFRQAIAVIAVSPEAGGDGASVALHRAAGFGEAGRLRNVGYKFGRWIDTVLMQLPLSDD